MENLCNKLHDNQLILLGKAGSGKGTQAILLRENLKIPLISFGEILKEEVNNNTPAGLILKDHVDRGTFASDHLVMDVFLSKFFSYELNKGFILEGFPRTKLQIQLFEDKRPNFLKKIKVIYLDLADEIAAERILFRFTCPKCYAVYNTFSKPSFKKGICDICHSKLYHREDDNSDAMRTRLDIFSKMTLPVIDYFERLGNLFKIDADQPIDKIYNDLLNMFKS